VNKKADPCPGIGRFAIYDEATVDEADLGVNFFVDQSCLGKSRAQCVTSLLCELNPEVEGAWYPNAEVRRPSPRQSQRQRWLTAR
jgi:NEDD8-activating enzyme E1 regulatory subunit